MLSKYFLERPVFAWVIAIFIMLLGGLGIYNLPIAQYPPIAPPSIAIEAVYPGASAQTVENSVTQIIEQKMTGFDEMIYLSGSSDSAGTSRIELTFRPGTDPDMAWAKVQNKLQLAMSSLPEVVQRSGVKVSKSTRNYLLIVGIVSTAENVTSHDLQDYAQSSIEKVLSRVPGVGEVNIFGSQYSMRVWLNPDKLTSYNLTFSDVMSALRAYNVEVSAGQFGGLPAIEGQRLNASIVIQNLLQTPEEFAAIPVFTNSDGSIVKVGDVGRVELGTEFYDVESRYNGMPIAGMAIRQAPGANALDTADAVKQTMEELSRYFPSGTKAVYPYDTTPFVRVAINEAVKSLFMAIGLVFLVMWLFMGNIRATLIPTIVVPVVLLGTCAALLIFGYSINMLTMFAMVIAIGLLVDDTIVVVENVERIMGETGLSPRDATARSMQEVTSALIGFTLVLTALFGPMAFFSGSTGIIYRQFSVTVVTSMVLSVAVALILTPVLCAAILRPIPKGHEAAEYGWELLRPFFLWFDRSFNRFRDSYVSLLGHALTRKVRYVLIYTVIVLGLGFLAFRIPTSYLPDEDQGVMLAQILAPSGTTLEQTQEIANRVQDYFMNNEKEAVESCMTIVGTNFGSRGQNSAMMFVNMRDWDLRTDPKLGVRAVERRANAVFSQIRGAQVFAFAPPAVTELGTSTGFDFQLVNRGGVDHGEFLQIRNQLLYMANQDPRLSKVRPSGVLEDVPEYRIDVDWEKAGAQGVPISSIHNTLSAALGGAYINDFIQGGRVKRVFVQADAPYRMLPSDLNNFYVRNTAQKMVPFSSFATGHWTSGPPVLERFNGFPSYNILGEAGSGLSSGEAMEAMQELTGKLPSGVGYDWTGMSYQERQASTQTGLLYTFCIVIVFLFLSALYGRWDIPLAVLLVLPLGIVGGFAAAMLRGLPSDIYFQIGLLNTLGLSTKNAILIVQFAMGIRATGVGLVESSIQAVKLRLRPILMTSTTTGLAVLPMALSTGAGAGAMRAIGTTVLGGMVTGVLLVLLFAPLFYVLIAKVFGSSKA